MTPDPPATERATPAPVPPTLARARAVSHVLDDLIPIPGTSWRVGIDPLMGLVPGAGDWLAWGVGLHLLWAAWRLDAGAGLLVRMSWNLLVDAVLGAVPLVGDVFDLAWKANNRNLALLESHVADRHGTERASRWVLGGILAGTLAVMGAAAWGAWWVVGTVWGWMF